MARGTTRKEDWTRFLMAVMGNTEGRHSNPVLDYILTILHTAKNIWVEELRRWGIETNPK